MSNTLMAIGKGNLLSLAANATRTTSSNGSGVDIQGYTGLAAIILDSTAEASTGTLDVTLEESDDNSTFTAVAAGSYMGGANFAQVTNAAASQQVIFTNVADRKRYLRAKWVSGGGSPSATFCVHVLAQKKYS
jgi:hypothetical protein